jgi:hypothetical protein
MKAARIAFEVPNSLVYIRDPTLVDLPEITAQGASWHTSSCVAVSCLPDCDGPTTIVIGPSEEVGLDRRLVFDGHLPSPSRALIVETVVAQELLRVDAPGRTTRLRVWTNGHEGTDSVIIGLN